MPPPSETDPHLSLQAKDLIRSFVIRLVIPSGIGLTLISFAFGFIVNDMAKKQAYVDAYAKAYEEAMKSQSAVVAQSAARIAEAEVTTKSVTKAMSEALIIADKIKSIESLAKSDVQVTAIAKALSDSPDFSNRVTALLGQQLATTNKWVKNIYGQAAQTGMPNHQGANGYWQQALIGASPAVNQELK